MHDKHQIKNKRSQQKNSTTQVHRATKIMQLPYQRRLSNESIIVNVKYFNQATKNAGIVNTNKKDTK